MERKVGEVFKYNEVTLITIENNSCEGCFFNDGNICTREARLILCSPMFRKDNKNVIFKEMETRTIKLTLEKAKEFYKKGGEFRDLALSAFTEEELTKVELPKTWEEFCKSYNMRSNECFINLRSDIASVPDKYEREINSDRNVLPSERAAKAHLALMQLHQLRDCYRQGWKPDWGSNHCKYSIISDKKILCVVPSINCSCFLSFQSEEIARLFLKNFRSLIEEAGDLI